MRHVTRRAHRGEPRGPPLVAGASTAVKAPGWLATSRTGRHVVLVGLGGRDLALEHEVPCAEEPDDEDGRDPHRPGRRGRLACRAGVPLVGARERRGLGLRGTRWRGRCLDGGGRWQAATRRRASRSAAAAAMIRPFSADDGSTCGTDASSAGSTEPASANSAWASGHEARWARTASSSAGSRAPEDEGAPPGRGRRRRSARAAGSGRSCECPPPCRRARRPRRRVSDRRIASSPSRIRLLTVPSGVPVRVGDLLLGQTAEVGELDRLALDVARGPSSAPRTASRSRPAATSAQTSGRVSAGGRRRPRARAARSSAGGGGRRRSRGGGRSRGARSSRCLVPRRSGRHSATRPGRRPGRRPRRGRRHP